MEAQRHPRAPHGCQSDSQVTPRFPKEPPRRSQGVPKDLPREHQTSQKASKVDTQAKKKVDALSKLGFVHRRDVFEPPKPKVDYLYYVFGTLEILILVKSNENIAPAMLLEHAEKPVLAWEREARLNE